MWYILPTYIYICVCVCVCVAAGPLSFNTITLRLGIFSSPSHMHSLSRIFSKDISRTARYPDAFSYNTIINQIIRRVTELCVRLLLPLLLLRAAVSTENLFRNPVLVRCVRMRNVSGLSYTSFHIV